MSKVDVAVVAHKPYKNSTPCTHLGLNKMIICRPARRNISKIDDQQNVFYTHNKMIELRTNEPVRAPCSNCTNKGSAQSNSQTSNKHILLPLKWTKLHWFY